ncbi:MAG: GIY-YIG nuclease family protein, partial [Alphaproteobacteria bacterium]
MADLPRSFTNIWLRSFYGFGPEEDGYIGWTKEVGRDHMLAKMQSGDLIMIYGAGKAETIASQRLRVLGFLQVDAVSIRDIDKASEAGMRRKRDNGWT